MSKKPKKHEPPKPPPLPEPTPVGEPIRFPEEGQTIQVPSPEYPEKSPEEGQYHEPQS